MDDKSKVKKKFRIDGFKQIDQFFEIVNQNSDIQNSAVALYFYLLHINNKLGWKEWFSLSQSDLMTHTRMAENTIYKAIDTLIRHELLERQKGTKDKAPRYKLPNLLTSKIAAGERIVEGLVIKSGENSGVVNERTFNNTLTDNKKNNERVTDNEKAIALTENFYKKELEENKNYPNNVLLEEYRGIINYIFGVNPGKKKLSNLLTIPNQLTFKEYNILSGLAKMNGESITSMLQSMNNKEQYYRGVNSVFATLQGWLNNSQARKIQPRNPITFPF